MTLQKVLSRVRQAVDDYHMIEEGDRIAVGISGGKDSLTLLLALYELSKFYPKHFTLIAVTVDLGFLNLNLDEIRTLCADRNIPYTIVDTSIAQIVFEDRKEDNPCSLCAKMRKGALIYSLVAMMLSQIVPSIVNIASNFDTYISNFTKWISKIMDDNPELGSQITFLIDKYSVELENWLNDTVLTKTSQVIMTVSLSVINILKGLWDFIIGFVISIYVLASKEKFAGQAKKMAYAFFEQKSANRLIKSFRFTHNTFIGFIGGKIVDSIIIGCLCFIGTTLLQTPYAALVSVIVGVTNIIPFFGPYLGAIPSAILILVVDPMHPLNCVYFVLFILVLQQFDGNFLGPKILGDSTGLTGFWVIFAITVFGGLFGILGMIVGVPIFAVIYAAIKAVVNTFLRKKDLPVETVKYSYLKNIDKEGFHHLDSRLQRDHEIKDQVDFEQDKKDQEEKNVGEK